MPMSSVVAIEKGAFWLSSTKVTNLPNSCKKKTLAKVQFVDQIVASFIFLYIFLFFLIQVCIYFFVLIICLNISFILWTIL